MFTDIKKALTIISPYLFTKENAPRISIAVSMMALSTSLNFLSAITLMEMISADNADDDSEKSDAFNMTLQELVGLFVTALIVSRMLQSARRIITNPLVSHTGFSLVLAINKHFMSLSYSHFAQTPIGSMSEYFTTGSTGAQDFTTQLFNQILPATIESLAAMGLAFFRFGPNAGLTFLGMFITYIVYNFAVASPIASIQKEIVKTRGDMTRAITSTLQNFETIQLFNNLEYEISKVDLKLTAVKNANTQGLSLPDQIAMGQWIIIAAGFIGLLSVTVNSLSLSDFIGLCFYLLLFVNLFSGFGDGISKARAACINLSQVAAIFAKHSDVPDHFPQTILHADNATIEFKNVSFAYDKKKALILKNLSFKVNPGEKVGIVGSSGAGKSTITRLLYRFYDYQEGEITINGVKINSVSLQSLRSAIAVVPQSTILFNDTLENNIWYGAIPEHGTTIDNNILQESLTAAALHDFVSTLPERLRTNVGERGLKVSGGQAQRVSIARALTKKTPIMVFDEATSALDTKTEQAIQSSLHKASQGKTTLIISHKLYNVKDADRIFVLRQGEKIEEGTHEQLLGLQGNYYEMWQKQSKEYERLSSQAEETKIELPPYTEYSHMSVDDIPGDNSVTSKGFMQGLIKLTQFSPRQSASSEKNALSDSEKSSYGSINSPFRRSQSGV